MAVVDVPTPHAKPGEVVVQVAHCGICGSDLHSFRTGFAAAPGQILGHEFCGTVVEAPGVSGIAVGARVTARPLIPCGMCSACSKGEVQLCEAGIGANIGYGKPGAFAERVVVPHAVVGETLFELPDTIDDRGGALIEPLAVALHAVRQAEAGRGQVAIVLGAGPIGLGVVSFLHAAEVDRLIVVDPSPLRRRAAHVLGADVLVDPAAEDAVDAIAAVTGVGPLGSGARADVVIDCAGVPAALRSALQATRPGGLVVLCAIYAAKVEIRPDRLTTKELTVRGSFAYRDEFPAVIDALSSGQIRASPFVSHELSLEDIGEAFSLQGDPAASLKVLVTP
jgi:2-desacetyl-2-hydroxyethyl bacteriochlorophyllide A dehydrogenase